MKADVLDATLVGDTYARTSASDENFTDSEFGLYVRNHREHGRIAMVQFALPKWICESQNAEELVKAQLSVMVSFTGWTERDITLELLVLDAQEFGKEFDIRFYSQETASFSEALSPARLQLTDTAPSDGSRGLRRFFDGWVDATPENTTTVVPGDGGKQAPGWTYRGHLPASDGPSIIGDRVWEASGSNVPTLVTTIRGLRPLRT